MKTKSRKNQAKKDKKVKFSKPSVYSQVRLKFTPQLNSVWLS